MSKTALVYLNVQVTGDGLDPQNLVPVFISNTNSPATHLLVSLTTGSNTITVPSSAMFVVIQPLVAGTVTKTLKGVTGDTGVALSTNQANLLALAQPPTSTFVITASAPENIDIWFF